jgi:hypothetical protein
MADEKSNRSMNTERVANRDRIFSDLHSQRQLSVPGTGTRRILLDELMAKMRSKSDMYEVLANHRKSFKFLKDYL